MRINFTTELKIKKRLLSVYGAFLLLLDTLCILFTSRKDETTSLKKQILIIKIDAIGDFLLWLDAAKELRNLFPWREYAITLLGNAAWTSIARKLPFFDDVWQVDRRKLLRSLFYRIRLMRMIRRAGFHTVIQPTFSREFLRGDSLVRVSGAKERIGSQGDYSNTTPWQKHMSDHWYSRLVPTAKGPLMELERNAEFMRGLGYTEFESRIPNLPSSVFSPSTLDVKDYYVLFPGAREGIRQWPLSCFREIAERMYQRTGWVGVVCGGPGEERLGKDLVRNNDIPLQNLVGRTSLLELISIIDGAHVLVGNETSAVHIAAAVSTPSVCIQGGGHFGRFLPYDVKVKAERPLPVVAVYRMECFGCGWRCIYKVLKTQPVPCIANVSVAQVWEQIESIIKKKYAKSIGDQ